MPVTINKAPKKRLYTVLLIVGLGCIIYASMQFFARWQATQGEASPLNPEVVIQNTATHPDERKIAPDTPYQVPDDQPKRIIISSIGVSAYIQKVSLDKTGRLAAPSNIHLAGWYTNSVPPGDIGLSVIDGHVSGRYDSEAVFARLGQAAVGSKFDIEFGDGSIRHFEVTEKKRIAEAETSELLFSKNPQIDKQLNLVTCSGAFDKDSGSYPDRTIVITKVI